MTTATNFDETQLPDLIRFLGTIPADDELEKLGKALREENDRSRFLRGRRQAIEQRSAHIDRALVLADEQGRTKLLAERAALAAESASLPGQSRQAAKRRVMAQLSFWQRVHDLAWLEIQRIDAELAEPRAARAQLNRQLAISEGWQNQNQAAQFRATLAPQASTLAREIAPLQEARDLPVFIVQLAQGKARSYGTDVALGSPSTWEWATQRAVERI